MDAQTTPRPHRAATAKGTYAPALADAVAVALRAATPATVELPQLDGLTRTWTLQQLQRPGRWQLTHAVAGRSPATFTWSRDIDAAAARMDQLDRAAQTGLAGARSDA